MKIYEPDLNVSQLFTEKKEEYIHIQSNLAIPTHGFQVTRLITSVFQSPDVLNIILI